VRNVPREQKKIMNHENNACEYDDRRDELFVAYLYDDDAAGRPDDAETGERALFAAHLATCALCRRELAELRAVRRQLAEWTPPQPLGPLTTWTTMSAANSPRRVRDRLAEIPAWAQVAAALLLLAVSARMANLQVRYDASGLSVQTGWRVPAQPAAILTSVPEPAGEGWRAELTALEERVRAELRTAASQPQASPSTTAPGDVLQRVRRLIEESERRQQRELALRVAEVRNEIEAQRQADLVRIDRTQRALQQETGLEVQRNRQMMNYIVRTSQTSQR
jgi:hypothetical protein